MKESLTEIDYPLHLVEKVTTLLNTIEYVNSAGKTCKLNPKMKGYIWYYVNNNGNKSDAYRRAYASRFNRKTNKLIPNKDLNVCSIKSRGYVLFTKIYIREGIRLLRDDIESKIKAEIPQTLLEQLQVQASYDPSMFIDPDGKPAFDSWEDIPLKYRCCVEGINTTRYGKNGNICETVIKLVNRNNARAQLLKIAPGLLEPDKFEVLHKTVDANGNETGINYSRLSDAELRELAQKTKG